MKYQVFISYRREGGEILGRMLYEELIRRGYAVFYDVESLRSGPFNTELFRVIDECTDVLVILPPGALDRCSDPEDWVRQEIAHALKQKKNVIPIIMRGFSFKDAPLPEDIAELANMNGISANMELFPAVMDMLTQKRMLSKANAPEKDNKTRQIPENDEEQNERRGELFSRRQIICGLLLIIILSLPLISRHWYTEQSWMPKGLNWFLMTLK
ncbi:MAG: toll/interleukin-1 receptor domain-containing protein, partial [Lachnospiraceae bacterium]|nr:toll/interleukin-1 receptor domain-containing protein [Lachnospiraceae bacterium]